MKVATVRRRMAAMTRRLEREMSMLDRMFPKMDLENQYGNAAETVRNLATAIAYARSFAAMSDEGILDEIGEHA